MALWADLTTRALQVRKHVNALGAAFSRRSDEAQASTLAHQLSLGVFALEDALSHGRPYAAAADQLARSAPDDELVASACQALPQEAAEKVRLLRFTYHLMISPPAHSGKGLQTLHMCQHMLTGMCRL